MKKRLFNMAFASLCLLSMPAAGHRVNVPAPPPPPAQPGPTNPEPLAFRAMYRFDFDGIPIGKMGIEVWQTPRMYTMTSDIVTTGLVKVFVRHSSHTTVRGTGDKDFIYPDRQYETHYQTRGKKKYVKIVTKGGLLTEDTLVPPDNPATRKPVAPEQVKGAADPLSIALWMRAAAWKAMQGPVKTFSIPLFDGRRLTEVNFTVEGQRTLRTRAGIFNVISVALSRTLLAGFTESELAEYNPHEAPARFFFTNDPQFIPVRAEVAVWMGTLSASLEQECLPEESCLLGISE